MKMLIIGYILGSIVGFLFAMFYISLKVRGCLRIETSDPDGPYLFLEMNNGLQDVWNEKHVIFKVKRN